MSFLDTARVLFASYNKAEEAIIIGRKLEDDPFSIIYINPALNKQTSYTQAEMIGNSFFKLMGPKTDKTATNQIVQSLQNCEYTNLDILLYKKTGEAFWSNISISPINKDYFICIQRDITASKNREQMALLKEKVLSTIYETLGEGIIIHDLVTNSVFTSSIAKEILGLGKNEEISFETFLDQIAQDDVDLFKKELENHLEGKTESYNEVCTFIKPDFSLVKIKAYGKAVRNANNKPVQLIISIKDITKEKELESKLNMLAYHDSLTEMFNRSYLIQEFEKTVATINFDEKLAITFIDFNDFKIINDTNGHKVGDAVLKLVAERIMENVSQTTIPIRLGGDEFILFHKKASVYPLVKKEIEVLVEAFAEPISIDKFYFKLSFSHGTAFYPNDGNTLNKLLFYADSEMYKMKKKIQK